MNFFRNQAHEGIPLITRQIYLVHLHLSASQHGTNIEKSFVFHQPINLTRGNNHIALLGLTVGMPV